MEGEDAVDDIKRTWEVVKLVQFVKCFPPKLHTGKWLVDKKDQMLVSAVKMANEFVVLYKQSAVDLPTSPKKNVAGWGRNAQTHNRLGFKSFAMKGRMFDDQFDENTAINLGMVKGRVTLYRTRINVVKIRTGDISRIRQG